jgi:hypothetical protein
MGRRDLEKDFDNFEQFWPDYLGEHRDRFNRLLHVAGTSAALATLAYGLVKREPKLAALAPLLGYGPAWIGHFLVEGNRPATFKHPLWSLRGDLRMLRMTLNGDIEQELAILDIIDANLSRRRLR